MNNLNTLVSLAYIKSHDNPLIVFCNYILYLLLKSPNQSLRADQLAQNLSNEFGLNMPHQMINTCIRILKKSNEVKILPNGAGYAIDTTNFDISIFEDTRRRLHEQENSVINSLLNFVSSNFQKTWTQSEAKNYLSSFLDKEGNGARLFLYEEIQPNIKQVSPSWFIGRFITQILQSEDCIEKTYLTDIINGLMIYQGIYQTKDYQQDKGQKFKGTTFYFDTKLILRALGYSWDAQVQSSRELIQLITEEYEGRVGIFSQTLSEVENALSRAGKEYAQGQPITDWELKVYTDMNPIGASLLTDTANNVVALLNKFKIQPPIDIDWNSSTNQQHTIEVENIYEYIKSKREWRPGAISNDVAIINQINILRKSDYSSRYGGKKKLPVFITTNSDLVYTFREYVSEISEAGSSIWNIHALPIISDNMLLFRLWVPYANKYSTLPALTLARYAYAAQNPNTQYFEKLKETAIAYTTQTGIDIYNLSEIRRQKLEDILITNSNGNSENITEELIATSVDELIKMENLNLHELVSNLEKTVITRDDEITKRDQLIIGLAAAPFINKKFFLYRLIILGSKIWWILATLILYFGASQLNDYISSNSTIPAIVVFAPVVIEVALIVLDKLLDNNGLYNFATKFAVKFLWKKYSNYISSSIPEEQSQYKEQIINYCLNHSPIFKKYKAYCV